MCPQTEEKGAHGKIEFRTQVNPYRGGRCSSLEKFRTQVIHMEDVDYGGIMIRTQVQPYGAEGACGGTMFHILISLYKGERFPWLCETFARM